VRGNLARNLRIAFLSSILAALIAASGCNRGPNQDASDAGSRLDHVSQSPPLAPQEVAHGLSKLQKYTKFPFDVPAHVISPRLTGEFTSFIQGAGGARISDESADVELMIMSAEQYDAFEKKTSAESVYAIEPSHDHEVSITLPTTQDTPVHYYAVFRRANEGKSPIWINANLAAEFSSL
jgi:hypothetical protein